MGLGYEYGSGWTARISLRTGCGAHSVLSRVHRWIVTIKIAKPCARWRKPPTSKTFQPIKKSSNNQATEKETARKSDSAKPKLSTSLDAEKGTKQSRDKAPLSASDSKATGITEGVKRIEPEGLRRQTARVSTLRPRTNCKRGKTGRVCCPLSECKRLMLYFI